MLYERYAKRRFQEGVVEGQAKGLAEGLAEGRSERDREWEAWLKRRDETLAAGMPFDEPPPHARASANGQ